MSCCSTRASICSLTLIFLFQTRVTVMPCLCTNISLQLSLNKVWLVVPCMRTSIGLRLLINHVWLVAHCLCTSISFQLCFSTNGQIMVHYLPERMSLQPYCGSLSVCTHRSTAPLLQRKSDCGFLFTSISVLSRNGYGNVECSVLWEW